MRKQQRKALHLLDTAGSRLHKLLARLTMREDVIGDLLQELFIRLCSSKTFDKARDPFAYACRVAINLAFEWHRQQKSACQLLQEDCLATENSSSTLAKLIRAEELQQVLDAASKLSDSAREVVVLRYIEQESYEKIAQQLGKKPQHMRSVCAKAMAQLRESLVNEKQQHNQKK